MTETGQTATGGTPQNPGSAMRIGVKERRLIVLELRKAGGSYRDIAAQMRRWVRDGRYVGRVSESYSEGLAYRDVKAELERLNDKLASEAGEVRRLEIERLEAILKVYYPRLLGGEIYVSNLVFSAMKRLSQLQGAEVMPPPTLNLGVDLSTLPDSVIDRLAKGEDFFTVILSELQSSESRPNSRPDQSGDEGDGNITSESD